MTDVLPSHQVGGPIDTVWALECRGPEAWGGFQGVTWTMRPPRTWERALFGKGIFADTTKLRV